ncbi:hypothetical protein [Donghicola sp. XS_ASV15]|uniref:hypothetical protein n=1 Tax=Donghicola sp. XS_ASV15 TaxID=3241295 RepID=UPI0035124570
MSASSPLPRHDITRRTRPGTHRRAMLLLAALRDLRQRNKLPAKGGLLEKPKRYSVKDIWQVAQKLRHVTSDKIAPVGGKRLALLDCPNPHTKARLIRDTMINEGCPPDLINSPAPMLKKDRHALRLRALIGIISLRPSRRWLSKDELAFCLAVYLHERMLKKASATVIHIGDRSSRRNAMAVGAAFAGVPSVYWQLGYHDVAIPNLGYTHAAVLNQPAEACVAANGTEPLRQTPAPMRPVTPPTGSQNIGLTMNAFAGPEVADLCRAVLSIFPDARLHLRTHPRVADPNLGDLPSQATVRPRGEPLEAFCQDCDIVLCGNSSVQIEMLLLGVLVIHIPGLDQHAFDLYKYVADGVTYGTETLSSRSVADAVAFYAREGWSDRLIAHVAAPDISRRPIHVLWASEDTASA